MPFRGKKGKQLREKGQYSEAEGKIWPNPGREGGLYCPISSARFSKNGARREGKPLAFPARKARDPKVLEHMDIYSIWLNTLSLFEMMGIPGFFCDFSLWEQ